MSYSISFCLFDTLMDPWKVSMYVCCTGDLIHHCYCLQVVGLFADKFVCITIQANPCVYFSLWEFFVS